MAAPAGIAGQVGFKSESAWGTAVTVDQFVPFVDEGIKNDVQRIESKGIMGGRLTQHRWASGRSSVGGPLQLELPNIQLATVLKHMFGTLATTGAGPYTHTASPGVLKGKSLTIQVGRPDVAGTVQPFTYAGCKFAGWELSCQVGELAMLKLDVVGKSETTGTALATASYSSSLIPFSFVQGSVSIAGSAVATVNAVTLACATTLKADRHALGQAVVNEQLDNGRREFTGRIDADFESLTAYNRYVNGTEAALVLAFSNGADSLTITMNSRFDGETPVVDGPEVLDQPLPYKALSSTSDAAAITAVLINTESSAA